MKDESLDNMEKRIEILEGLVSGDPRRNMTGVVREVSGLRADFEDFKDVWNRRADMFRGILWALGGNGLLGVMALIMQILGIGG